MLLCFVGILAYPPNLSRLAATSKEVQARDGQVLSVFAAPGGVWRLRTRVEDVDPRYIDLLVAAEDRRFFSHAGVDGGALLRAAWQYVRAGRIVSGGSTLSMQVARLLEPHRRGVLGKLHDIIRAVQIEARYSKPQILGMYLTLAPMGGNIEGVRAASLAWFGHGPAHLSQAEAALLVALPQSPARRRPDRNPAVAMQAAAHLLARLGAAGSLPAFWSGGVGTSGLAGGLRRHDMPHAAALFCAGLLRATPAGTVLRSTIDAGVQARLEGQIARGMAGEAPSVGVALVAVDNVSREVRASIGGRGAGFAGSALDLTQRRRSPGSALKPFIYGMAFDSLVLHPLTEIDDAPGLVAGYAPHNFDYQYHGGVSAQTALRQSFNVPAVQVLARVGAERFVSGLREAGARIALPGRRASLAVALGGLGISLSDMVMLYAALGDDGQASALVSRAGEARGQAPFMGKLAIYYLRGDFGGLAAAAGGGLRGRDRRTLGRVQDRHVLRVSRCLGSGLQRALDGGGVDGARGGLAAAWRVRPRDRGAADVGCVRVAAAGGSARLGAPGGRDCGVAQCGFTGGAAPVGWRARGGRGAPGAGLSAFGLDRRSGGGGECVPPCDAARAGRGGRRFAGWSMACRKRGMGRNWSGGRTGRGLRW